MSFDPLKIELIGIIEALHPHGIDLIVGGGYGLYLRTEHILKTHPRTRFSDSLEARSTEDLDFFLSVDIITDVDKMEIIRDVIRQRRYEPVAKYFQFEKRILVGGNDLPVKIDLLAPRPTSTLDLELVKISEPRIRPRGVSNIHAYITDEAISLNDGLSCIDISNDESAIIVFLPHPFTYLLLKIFAFRDHLAKGEDRSKAKEHASDIYRTIGMMTEPEWKDSIRFSAKHATNPIVTEASEIVAELYSSSDGRGPIETYRLLGKSAKTEANIGKVIEDLTTLFPPKQ